MMFEHTYTHNNYENMFRLQYFTHSFKRDVPFTVATWLEADMFLEHSCTEIIVFYSTQDRVLWSQCFSVSYWIGYGVGGGGGGAGHLNMNNIMWSTWCNNTISVVVKHMNKFLFAFILTYSREQWPSWEGNWFSSSEEIPCIIWNSKVHYHIHKCCHLPLSWPRSIQTMPSHPTSWRSIILLSSHLCLGLPSGLCLRFPNPVHISALSHTSICSPTSFFSMWSPEQSWVRSTDH